MEHLYLNNKRHCNDCSKSSPYKRLCSALNNKIIEAVDRCPSHKFDNNENWFPVLIPYGDSDYGTVKYYVPFSMIQEHESQCFINHGQSPHRLKERGGLSWDEMWAVVHDIHWNQSPFKSPDEAKDKMIEFAKSWQPSKEEDQEKEFIVPVEWSVCGFVKIRAANAETAIQLVHQDDGDIPLPSTPSAEYLDGSYGVSGYDNLEECIAMVEEYTKSHEAGCFNNVIYEIK